MENPQRTPYNGFMGTQAAKVTGLFAAFIMCFFFAYLGWFLDQCLMVFIGVVMFVIPKLFGVKSTKAMLALGAVFLLVTPTLGALAFTAPFINNNTQSGISGEFSDVEITETGDSTYTVTVVYTGDLAGDVFMYTPTVGTTSFTRILIPTNTDPAAMTAVGGNKYQYTGLELRSGTLYGIYFKCISGDDSRTSGEGVIDANITKSDVTKHALVWNFYAAGLAMSIYFLIVILTALMRRRIEKTRARLEAEGRLYPQGYGRCKQCGMMVLPGETVCRKCGAYIEVPEEIKAKMKHKVDFTVCSECGAEVPADARRCPKCGASFDEETEEIVVSEEEAAKIENGAAAANGNECFECSECGAKVPENAEQCPKCGAKFDKE